MTRNKIEIHPPHLAKSSSSAIETDDYSSDDDLLMEKLLIQDTEISNLKVEVKKLREYIQGSGKCNLE